MKGRYRLVSETPEMERVRANQRHISSVQYREEVGHGTPVMDTPEMERVRRNQENISSVKYRQSTKACSVGVTPELERVKQNQQNISSARHTHTHTHTHTLCNSD
uniref:Nebulin-like n=1 Tax=Poecilia latipinna TaxID=48699 RepID=A0A3B3TUX4_9TELE